MEITFNSITASRAFPKAMKRHAELISLLRRTAAFISTESLPFDVLQIILLDRDASYARSVGRKGDRIYQYEVAAPKDDEVDFAQAKAFVGCLADRLKIAANGCGLPKETAELLTQNIELAKNSL